MRLIEQLVSTIALLVIGPLVLVAVLGAFEGCCSDYAPLPTSTEVEQLLEMEEAAAAVA